jgi:vancomycin aglycone glucosyltransferase
MRVLIASIGTRGEVQPMLALALELRALGHEPRLCVAPNFKDWVESFGVTCLPTGPDLKKLTSGSKPFKVTPQQRLQFAAHAVRSQFPVLTDAARGCDVLVAGGALMFAARSIAESLQIPYVFAAYCPVVLPSPHHPPPKMGTHHSQSLPATLNRFLWKRDERNWNQLFGAALNEERAKIGLPAIDGVRAHIFTDRPWLAADRALAPVPSTPGLQVTQTGAWFLKDQTPLPNELQSFLANGDAPIYFGFGSMSAPEETGRVLIEAARALKRRAIVSQGWGHLALIDGGTDCLSIGEVNHEKLFARVAAVVHHGGAGTTTSAMRAGRAQVIVPHLYDQFYWARRVR